MNTLSGCKWISVSAVAGLLAGGVMGEDWPFFRGPDHNGVSSETGWQVDWPESGPRVAWEAEAGVGAASVTVAGNRAVTMGSREDLDVITCYEAETGNVLWKYPYACKFDARMFEGGTASTPTIAEGNIYTLSYNGQFHCLDLETGKVVWKTNLVDEHGGRLPQWAFSGSPLVQGDLVIIDNGGDGTSTLALDRKTGEQQWAVGKDTAGYASPIPFAQDDRNGVLVFKGKHMVAYDIKNGKEQWRIPWETDYDVNASSPLILRDKLFISSGYKGGRGALYQLGGGQPRELWVNKELKTKMSSCAALDGHVYGITEKKSRLLCLELDSGEIVWEERGFTQNGTLLIVGTHIVALTDQGEAVVVEANPEQYSEISRAEVLTGRCWVNPAFSGGRLFCKNNDGHIKVLDLRSESYP